MTNYKMYVGGEWIDAAAGETFETKNPYTGETWATLPRGRAADAERAVTAAKAAFNSPEWSKMKPSVRGQLLRRLGDLIAENVEHLAATEVADNGKLLAEMRGQVRYLPQYFYYFGGLADKIEGGVLPIDKADTFTFTNVYR